MLKVDSQGRPTLWGTTLAVFLAVSTVIAAKEAAQVQFPQSLCVYVKPPLLGGVSNSLAVLNTAQTFAATAGDMRLVVPAFKPAQPHGEKPGLFDDMFTARRPAWNGEVASQLSIPVVDNVLCKPASNKLSCFPKEMYVVTADGRTIGLETDQLKSHLRDVASAPTSGLPKVFSGCRVVLQLPGERLRFHHNYQQSRPHIFQLYHGSKKMSAPDKPVGRIFGDEKINVAIHHRLGDVLRHFVNNSTALRKEWLTKLVSPQYALFCVKTLARILRHPKECLNVHVFTDARVDFPDIEQMSASLDAIGLDLHLHGQSMNGKTTLNALTHADVLIAGRSGYSRVAGMLSDTVSVAPSAWSHPVYGLPGFVVLDKDGPGWEWTSSWSENSLEELLESREPWAVKFRVHLLSKVTG